MHAAALVPDTVLLLPGVTGRAPQEAGLVALREAAAAVVTRVVRGADRVVVVAPGPRTRSLAGRVALGAAAAGVPDHLLGVPVEHLALAAAPGGPPVAAGAPTSGAVLGCRLVRDAGTPGTALHVVEVARGSVDALRRLGAGLGRGGAALVVVGSGSARHGDDAPLAPDPRAADLDARLVAALRGGGAAARDALAGCDSDLAAALAVTGWAPWQILVGAVDAQGGRPAPPDVRHAAVWRGVGHVAVAWGVAP